MRNATTAFQPIRVAMLVVDDRFGNAAPAPLFGTAPTSLLQGIAALGGEAIQMHVICCVQQSHPAPEKLADNIWYHQCLVSKLGHLRTFYSGCILAVRKVLREIQPDVVHAQGTERWCAISGALGGAYPKLLTIHGNLRVILKTTPMKPILYWKLQALLEGFCIPRFDGVLCISEYTKGNVRALARKTWMVHNAVDQNFFEIPHHLAEPAEILFLGHIQERKNQVAFIDAVEPLAKQFRFRLKFFGRAVESDPFAMEFFDRIHRHAWCEYGGMIPREAIKNEFSRATALVLPSLEDNCPMSVLEAMAARVPILAADVGGVPDLIKHGQTGLLCDPTSPDSMRTGFSELLASLEQAAKRAAAAQNDAEIRFHPKIVASKHLNVYASLIPYGQPVRGRVAL